MAERYKRTKSDSPLKCPYCGKQFTMNYQRYISYERGDCWWKALTNTIPRSTTTCKGCGKEFRYRNISAKTAREYGIRATFKMEEAIAL